MSDPTKRSETNTESKQPSDWRSHIRLEHETSLFILASVLDVIMTWFLLSHHREAGFIESNPIARFFIDHWGIMGMVYFKFALVAFTAVICQVIAQRREDVARRILQFAIVVVALVVIYSFSLLLRYSYSVFQAAWF